MFTLLLPLVLAFTPVQDDCASGCRADINQDGMVSMQDLQLFLQYYDGIVDENTELIDMNCDGVESITDYTILLSFYGQSTDVLGCE